ncbi:type VI secretion system baseplate subunit TssG [Marinomonas spartinae]|uniref:type VI secretion system baseplate subunit TssG n=1 Tax=Marinomonas spartinae TaxID=1792290 RepID=UPI0018F1A6C5|nr:type VI secretion system baseplate subunit TssG [Marinomonas spartinae]MBJ7554749.1 type VI secretion system baseplate subunit TssG [Marinomonas spartinae]
MMKQLSANASQLDFYKAIYLIEKQLDKGQMAYRKVGYDCDPKNELVRFSSTQKFGFPGTSISRIEPVGDPNGFERVNVDISFMGLTGSSGVMPQFYSELVLLRMKYKDTAMRDFYDMFNHRLISLYYRSWKKYKHSLNLSNNVSHQDAHTKILSLLSGGNSNHNLFFSGLFFRKIKNVSDLKNILTSYLRCEVKIEQLVGKWQHLKPSEQTRLASQTLFEGQYARLGVNAFIGSRMWDISTLINIHIFPHNSHQLKNLFPNGESYKFACKIIRDYVGNSVQFRILVESDFDNSDIARLNKKDVALGGNSILAFSRLNTKKHLRLSRKG